MPDSTDPVSLWTDEFSMVELDEIMRQRGDQQFSQLLCRLRKAECTEEELKSRALEDSDPEYLTTLSMCILSTRYNISKLNASLQKTSKL